MSNENIPKVKDLTIGGRDEAIDTMSKPELLLEVEKLAKVIEFFRQDIDFSYFKKASRRGPEYGNVPSLEDLSFHVIAEQAVGKIFHAKARILLDMLLKIGRDIYDAIQLGIDDTSEIREQIKTVISKPDFATINSFMLEALKDERAKEEDYITEARESGSNRYKGSPLVVKGWTFNLSWEEGGRLIYVDDVYDVSEKYYTAPQIEYKEVLKRMSDAMGEQAKKALSLDTDEVAGPMLPS